MKMIADPRMFAMNTLPTSALAASAKLLCNLRGLDPDAYHYMTNLPMWRSLILDQVVQSALTQLIYEPDQ